MLKNKNTLGKKELNLSLSLDMLNVSVLITISTNI